MKLRVTIRFVAFHISTVLGPKANLDSTPKILSLFYLLWRYVLISHTKFINHLYINIYLHSVS